MCKIKFTIQKPVGRNRLRPILEMETSIIFTNFKFSGKINGSKGNVRIPGGSCAPALEQFARVQSRFVQGDWKGIMKECGDGWTWRNLSRLHWVSMPRSGWKAETHVNGDSIAKLRRKQWHGFRPRINRFTSISKWSPESGNETGLGKPKTLSNHIHTDLNIYYFVRTQETSENAVTIDKLYEVRMSDDKLS